MRRSTARILRSLPGGVLLATIFPIISAFPAPGEYLRSELIPAPEPAESTDSSSLDPLSPNYDWKKGLARTARQIWSADDLQFQQGMVDGPTMQQAAGPSIIGNSESIGSRDSPGSSGGGEDGEDGESSEDGEDGEGSEDGEDGEGSKNSKDSEGSEDSKDSKVSEVGQNGEGKEDSEDSEDSEDEGLHVNFDGDGNLVAEAGPEGSEDEEWAVDDEEPETTLDTGLGESSLLGDMNSENYEAARNSEEERAVAEDDESPAPEAMDQEEVQEDPNDQDQLVPTAEPVPVPIPMPAPAEVWAPAPVQQPLEEMSA